MLSWPKDTSTYIGEMQLLTCTLISDSAAEVASEKNK